jgi:predicted Fe-Mo cluster-binding NifX family protein
MNMKVAIPTRNGQIDDHFGHCEMYTIYTLDCGKIFSEETLNAPEGCGCKSGVAPLLAEKGVKVMLAGNMGMGALNTLNHFGIEVYRGCSGNVKDLIDAYLEGYVKDSGEGCHNHEQDCHKE